MAVKDEIEDRLTAAFAPSVLEVVNESHRHAGHAGDDGSGESHFHVTIRAEALAAMNRVARHRAPGRREVHPAGARGAGRAGGFEPPGSCDRAGHRLTVRGDRRLRYSAPSNGAPVSAEVDAKLRKQIRAWSALGQDTTAEREP